MRPSSRAITGSPFKNKGKSPEGKPSAKLFAIRPLSNDPNKYSALAILQPIDLEFSITPFPSLPPTSNKPFKQIVEPCSHSPSGLPRYSFPQTIDSYTMKAPKSFKEAVAPSTASTTDKTPKVKETFEIMKILR